MKRWSDSETAHLVTILRESPTMVSKKIAEMLGTGRSESSVRNKIKYLFDNGYFEDDRDYDIYDYSEDKVLTFDSLLEVLGSDYFKNIIRDCVTEVVNGFFSGMLEVRDEGKDCSDCCGGCSVEKNKTPDLNDICEDVEGYDYYDGDRFMTFEMFCEEEEKRRK